MHDEGDDPPYVPLVLLGEIEYLHGSPDHRKVLPISDGSTVDVIGHVTCHTVALATESGREGNWSVCIIRETLQTGNRGRRWSYGWGLGVV